MKKHLSAVRHELQKITLFTALLLSIGNTALGQVPNYVPANGLVGWWPFNGNANDLSGNGNNGTVNGATLTIDRFGNANQAYSFDGVNDKIISTIINPLQANWSVSFWYKSLNGSSNFQGQNIIGIGSDMYGWGGAGFQISGQNPPGQCPNFGYLNKMYMFDASQECGGNFLGGVSYSNSNWYNVVIIKNNLSYDFILNNVLISSSVLLDINIDKLIFGNRDISFQYFNGNVDDIGAWNRALSACEISQLYNSQLSNPQLNAGNNLSICEGDSVTLTATGAATYGWDNGIVNGQAFLPTIEGYYTVVGTDSLGCSNSDSLFLDLLQPTASTIERIACDTYLAPDSAIYSTSGTYTSIIQNAAGCDSTITLVLTVNNSSTSTQTATGVDSYTWPVNGQTYTQSGVYAAVIPNSKGCDSTITLNLSLEFSGISELNGKEIVITPNPVDASFTLISDSKYIGNEYVITNQQGAIVGKGTVRATKMEVNCGHLAKGIYLFHINSTDQHVIRVMKN
jgi:hypothetical protein